MTNTKDKVRERANMLKPKEIEPKPNVQPTRKLDIDDVVDGNDFYPPKEAHQSPAEEDDVNAQNVLDVRNYLMALQSPMAAPEVRKRIEANLKPMDIGDLILTEELRQEVEIRKGLRVVYRTLTASEDMFVKSHVPAVEGTPMELFDAKRSLYMLAMGLYSLNGTKVEPWHLGKSGIDVDAVEARLQKIFRLPVAVASMLTINYSWFQERVEKLVSGDDVEEQVKNG